MKEKTIKYLKKYVFILAGMMGCICLVMGCKSKEIVFEAAVNEQAVQDGSKEHENAQEDVTDSRQINTQETDSMQEEMQTGSTQMLTQASDVQGETIPAADEAAITQPQECYVDICGAVVTPGVYQVYADTRIYEVILLAGGLTPDAEQSCINQALLIYDGMKLIVPTKAEWESGEFRLDEQGMVVSAGKEQVSAAEETDGLININEATVEELCTLPGVGSTKAESIVAYREQYGKFSCIEDIKKVAGIKDGLFEKIKLKIEV